MTPGRSRGTRRICVREDLPFMDLAGKYAEEIPFHSPLEPIDETHRRGIGVGGDDA
ncbi:hypothetical protein [Imhoffiella purpurea]|uniref:Uncharacterized protein n=1 Tax=Imhoffiella purpurea TaxID=1249627 RepID=W9V2G0_9GAMM|nr:hypothetical protein [Imhoffiella purpurea]EXJ13688.1 hypothetical protein D779_3443 [Imhoffiella purpurea]